MCYVTYVIWQLSVWHVTSVVCLVDSTDKTVWVVRVEQRGQNEVRSVWKMGVMMIFRELRFSLQAFRLTSTLSTLSTARYASPFVPLSACPASCVKVDSTTDTKVQAITQNIAQKP